MEGTKLLEMYHAVIRDNPADPAPFRTLQRHIASTLGVTYNLAGIRGRVYREQKRHALHMTQVDSADADSDYPAWQKAFKQLPTTIRLAFLTDLHLPDHDPRALELALKIVQDFQPHIVPHGSDVFDFETISRFPVDPRDAAEDVWIPVQQLYLAKMRDVASAAPAALHPFIVGNHDIRVWRFMTQQAPQFRATVSKAFTDTIRAAGGLWFGFKADQIRIGSLILLHGRTSGINAAKMNGDKITLWQDDVLTGHVHKAQSYTMLGSRRKTTSVTSGCLCNLQPRYSNHQHNWQQGIVLATIDCANDSTHFDLITFDKYRAVWGGKEYKA